MYRTIQYCVQSSSIWPSFLYSLLQRRLQKLLTFVRSFVCSVQCFSSSSCKVQLVSQLQQQSSRAILQYSRSSSSSAIATGQAERRVVIGQSECVFRRFDFATLCRAAECEREERERGCMWYSEKKQREREREKIQLDSRGYVCGDCNASIRFASMSQVLGCAYISEKNREDLLANG